MSNKNSGKGMTPKKGYNAKNWYHNFDDINWSNSKKAEQNCDISSDDTKKCCGGGCHKKDS
jgi:hypothetical protein